MAGAVAPGSSGTRAPSRTPLCHPVQSLEQSISSVFGVRWRTGERRVCSLFPEEVLHFHFTELHVHLMTRTVTRRTGKHWLVADCDLSR